jgi:isopenicillin N synthase-like dioxygenase
VRENYEEIASFHRELFDKVARKLFVLMSVILELPENFLADAHAYGKRSDDHLRYMIYNVRSQEEWDRAQAYTKGGHTDFGSLTLLFSQQVAGLQIRMPEGKWKWVKPVEGGITCNAADTLTFLTKGESYPSQSTPSLPSADRCRVYQIDGSPSCHPSPRPNQYPPSWSPVLRPARGLHNHEACALATS